MPVPSVGRRQAAFPPDLDEHTRKGSRIHDASATLPCAAKTCVSRHRTARTAGNAERHPVDYPGVCFASIRRTADGAELLTEFYSNRQDALCVDR